MKQARAAPARRGRSASSSCRAAARSAPTRPACSRRSRRCDHTPDWVAGISIGAINAALIAGNPPERRVERLREFWEGVSSFPFGAVAAAARRPSVDGARDAVNETNATIAMLFGVAGFFSPRVPAAPFQPPGTPAAISYYDTAPLRAVARAAGRLRPAQLRRGPALGRRGQRARRGNFVLLRQPRTQRIDARHIMASGALPPGLSADRDRRRVLLGRRPRLQHAAAVRARRARRTGRGWCSRSTCSPRAARCRRNLAEASEREKDIRYSSRTRLNTTYELRRQATLQAARRLVAKPAAEPARRPRRRGCSPPCRCEAAVDVVHLIYRSKHYESQSKDYEFSRASMLEHWAAGLADTQATLEDPRWLGARPPTTQRRARVRPRVGRRRDRTKTITPTTGLTEDALTP